MSNTNTNTMIADRDVPLYRPSQKMFTPTLTRTEVRILRFYQSVPKKPNKVLGGGFGGGHYFIRSLSSIAAATDCDEKTVRRANEHFAQLGILMWKSGHGNGITGEGQANQIWAGDAGLGWV